MPGGVASSFVHLLEDDLERQRRRLWVWIALAVVLVAPALWLWFPWGGVAHLGGLLVGALVGFLVAQKRVLAYQDSLRGTWRLWMKHAEGSQSVDEAFRKIRGLNSRPSVLPMAAALTFLWAIELIFLAFAFDKGANPVAVVPLVGLNGLAAGIGLVHGIRHLVWLRGFKGSLDAMVRSGEIGQWGTV